MPIIALIIVGAAAGFIATRLMKIEANMITTISIGVLGALFGGFVLRLILTITGWMAGFVGAVIGAMVLIWLWNTYGPKGR
ncbi:MAG: GlsB/YeaQ/YmgE family stress response membrane protein [Albidovulum sp.]